MKHNFFKQSIFSIFITVVVFLSLYTLSVSVIASEETNMEISVTDQLSSLVEENPLLADSKTLGELAKKAIDHANESAEKFPQFFKSFQYEHLETIRPLYTPTGNVIVAYVFELKDGENHGYVVMNAETGWSMKMSSCKSPYLLYLEEAGKENLDKNEFFIYGSIDCWVGTIEEDEVTIEDTYTDKLVAVEKRSNSALDQRYQEFHTVRVQSEPLSEEEMEAEYARKVAEKAAQKKAANQSSRLVPNQVRAIPDEGELSGVGFYTQSQTKQLCIPSSITNAFAYYRNTLRYTALWASNASISSVAAAIAGYMVSPTSNAYIETAVTSYASSKGYEAFCDIISNPSYYDYKFEIYYGDCPLIGFKEKEYGGGHMTTGVGYYLDENGQQKIIVSDNHSSSPVEYIFSE
ncbi:MAG: hypothetical protein J6M38_05000, partial [Lentisphaeria bacterium]|nr:hypothetical protein [Lentisphaeria bacterium]